MMKSMKIALVFTPVFLSSAFAGEDLPYLGHKRAVEIVTTCADTSGLNLSRTVAELGVAGIDDCVFSHLKKSGYLNCSFDPKFSLTDLDNRLISIVAEIQNCAKTSGE